MCGLDSNCLRGNIRTKLQRMLFEAIFLDDKGQKIWHGNNVDSETVASVFLGLCNLVTIHPSKQQMIEYLSNSCAIEWIVSQVFLFFLFFFYFFHFFFLLCCLFSVMLLVCACECDEHITGFVSNLHNTLQMFLDACFIATNRCQVI